MGYQVLARKWRPQQFDDVVGQAHVTETLKNAITSDRLAHAYLFVGPRGIGKTSVARIFAKALNCEKGPSVTPCDACPACREIMSGSSLDVMEIDGASNNSVDQVRDLRETVKYMPTRGKFKIYIIDEVHMLSTAAFNALLKTLEEPPPHVKFMFATTEPDRILATIISRCQRFDLRRIPTPLIGERLELIAKAEDVTITADAILAIARGSEGGLRDAESAMDQLISFKGKNISEEDVLSVFGLVSRELLEGLGEGILKGDIKGIIGIVARLDEAGKDLQRLVVELMEWFRHLLVCLNVDDASMGVDLSASQMETLRRHAELTHTDRVLTITRILGETMESMRYALSRRTLLETALIRCARAAVVVSLEEILKRVNALRDALPDGDGSGGGSAGTSQAAAVAPQPGGVPQQQLSLGAEAVEADETAAPPAQQVPVVSAADTGADLKRLLACWQDIARRAGRIAVLTAEALRDARPLAVSDAGVEIGFDPEFAAEAERFDVARNRRAIEHVLSEELGRPLKVACRVMDRSLTETVAEAAPAEGSAKSLASAEAPSVAKAGAKSKSLQEWIRVPQVAKVLELFGGTLLDVRV